MVVVPDTGDHSQLWRFRITLQIIVILIMRGVVALLGRSKTDYLRFIGWCYVQNSRRFVYKKTQNRDPTLFAVLPCPIPPSLSFPATGVE